MVSCGQSIQPVDTTTEAITTSDISVPAIETEGGSTKQVVELVTDTNGQVATDTSGYAVTTKVVVTTKKPINTTEKITTTTKKVTTTTKKTVSTTKKTTTTTKKPASTTKSGAIGKSGLTYDDIMWAQKRANEYIATLKGVVVDKDAEGYTLSSGIDGCYQDYKLVTTKEQLLEFFKESIDCDYEFSVESGWKTMGMYLKVVKEDGFWVYYVMNVCYL